MDKVGKRVGEIGSIHVFRLHAETAVRIARRNFGKLVKGIVDGTRTIHAVGLPGAGNRYAQPGAEPLVDVVVHVDTKREAFEVRAEHNAILLHIAAREGVFHVLRTA